MIIARDWPITRTRTYCKSANDLGEARKSHIVTGYTTIKPKVAWRGGVRAPRESPRPLRSPPHRLAPSLPPRLIPRSFSSLAAHRSFMLSPRLCSVLKAMSYICKANARSFARVSASTRSRACVRADLLGAYTGRVACESAQWRDPRSWQKLPTFRRKARHYLTETKLGLEVSRRPRAPVEFRVWFSKINRAGSAKLSTRLRKWFDRKFPYKREISLSLFLSLVKKTKTPRKTRILKRFVLNRHSKFGKISQIKMIDRCKRWYL